MNKKRRKFLRASGGAVTGGVLVSLAGASLWGSVSSSVHMPAGNTDEERIQSLLARKEPNIWLFTGDSITHGAKHTHGYRSYPEVFQERIRWEISRVRDVVINTGISGNAANNILSDFDWRIGQFSPHVVSVMIGTNDCAREGMNPEQFRKNVAELISKIRGIHAIPVLHTPNVIILDKSPERQSLPEYIFVLRQLAEKEDVVQVDNYAYWESAMDAESPEAVFQKWLNDPLHPNQYGHQEIARLMFKKLQIFDPDAATCGGPYYEWEH